LISYIFYYYFLVKLNKFFVSFLRHLLKTLKCVKTLSNLDYNLNYVIKPQW